MATIPELRTIINKRKKPQEPQETTEASLLDKVLDLVPSDIVFSPSPLGKFISEPRRSEAIQDIMLRTVTGLPIEGELRQEVRKPEDISALDFISTQGRVRGTVEELLPEIKLPIEDDSILNPGKEYVNNQIELYREMIIEFADLAGFILRPDQMFGILPLFSAGLKLTGGSIKKVVGIIKKAGIKKGMPVEQASNAVKKQIIKETGVKGSEIDRYLADYHDFMAKPGSAQKPINYTGVAKEVAEMYDRAEVASLAKRKTTPKDIYQWLNKKIVDVSGNTKAALAKTGDAGREAIMRHDVIAGAHSKAIIDYNNVAKKVYGKLSRSEIKQLNRMIQSRRTIAISRFKDIKHPEALGADKHAKFINNMPPELRQKLQERANLYFGEMKIQLKKLHNEGLIDDKLYETLLKQGDYSPRRFLQHVDPDRISFDAQGRRISVPDSGLRALEEGSIGLMENDSSLLLSNVIARTQARIYRNRANQALHRLAEINPDNGVVRIAKLGEKEGLTIKPSEFAPFSERFDITPGKTKLSQARAKDISKTSVFHGTGGEEAFNIVNTNKISTSVSTLDRAGQKAVSLSRNKNVSATFGDIVFEVKNSKLALQKAPKGVVKGDIFEGFEVRVSKDIPLKDVKAVHIIADQGLQAPIKQIVIIDRFGNTEARTIGTVSDLVDKFLEKGVKVIVHTEKGLPIISGEKAKFAVESVFVMIKGKPVEMFMPREFAKEWLLRDPEISTALAETLGWLSGSKLLKPMATGLNPGFAITNLPRDIAHAWLTTKEYSSVLPKALTQLGRDMSGVFKDAILRKGQYIDYINEGGGMEFLTHQGRIINPVKGALGKLQTFMGYVGETSEIMGRLMLRRRAILNGKSAQEATWIARNYLDFSQGGSFVKAVDTAVPYLNAGIQGTRGIIRAGIADPATFTFKVAQVGTLASGLYLANRHVNPEGWAQISDRDKVNNWIIMTPFSFTDKNGDKKHVYFKIAKDQGQRLFATAFEAMMAKYMGEDLNWTQIAQSIKDAMPASITHLPPTISAMLGYLTNKDFWLNEDVWKGHEAVEAGEEYHVDTHPAFVTLGQTTGLSPERTRHALSQLFTRGNPWTAIVGISMKQIFDEMPENFREETTIELILKQPIIKRMVSFTRPFTEFRETFKEIRKEAATAELKQNREFNRLSIGVIKKKLDRKELSAFIQSQPKEDRARLKTKHIQNKRIEKVPDKRFWKEVRAIRDVDARAKAYFAKWEKSGTEKRRQLDRNLITIPGVRTPRFQRELNRLKKEKGK